MHLWVQAKTYYPAAVHNHGSSKYRNDIHVK